VSPREGAVLLITVCLQISYDHPGASALPDLPVEKIKGRAKMGIIYLIYYLFVNRMSKKVTLFSSFFSFSFQSDSQERGFQKVRSKGKQEKGVEARIRINKEKFCV